MGFDPSAIQSCYLYIFSLSNRMKEDRFHCLSRILVLGLTCVLLFYLMYLLKDYVHAVLLWAESQPPWAIIFIFIALFTLVSLPLAWGYIVVNLACGYLFGALYGLLVTVFTATTGIFIAHIISKVIIVDYVIAVPNIIAAVLPLHLHLCAAEQD